MLHVLQRGGQGQSERVFGLANVDYTGISYTGDCKNLSLPNSQDHFQNQFFSRPQK